MTALLVVANQTLGSRNLADYLDAKLAAAGSLSVDVLVPLDRVPAWGYGDPLIGDFWPDASLATYEQVSRGEASDRLHSLVVWLDGKGVPSTGSLVEIAPLHAIVCAATRAVYDEIVISTLPLGISRWLHTDLPHRVERRLPVPVATIVDDFRRRKNHRTVRSTSVPA